MRKKKAADPNLAAILEQGLQSQFWQTLKKTIEDDHISKLEDTILDEDYMTDGFGNQHLLSEKVEISRRELARLERSQWIGMLSYPETKIKQLTQKSIELDPDKA